MMRIAAPTRHLMLGDTQFGVSPRRTGLDLATNLHERIDVHP
jgi:hypothetical protein